MTAMLDGVPFRVNPQSVKWPYSLKLATTPTIGGKVVQLYGVSLGDLTVTGVFGHRGPDEQRSFYDRITKIIDTQMPKTKSDPPRPVRFFWPERGWDFWCFIKSFAQIGASTSIKASNLDFAPEYRLTMFIQEDNGDLVKAAKESAAATFISRLSAGMGWKASDWNGPQNLEDALDGKTILDSLVDRSINWFTDPEGFINNLLSEQNVPGQVPTTGSNGVQ